MTETLQNLETQKVEAGAPVRRKQMTDEELLAHVQAAVHAAEEKKAVEVVTLRLIELTSFTDYFVICSGNSVRQVQAIADEVTDQLKKRGVRPQNTEGYNNAEWILIDYGAFVVHIFSGAARRFYDLERLWRDAARVDFPESGNGGAEAPSN
ncbi:MAG TPA: ribosome silencing factor [Blastocatellia bacterium]|nr:ribosome silencing factor [Blastocatellia bacterium]